MTNIAANRTAPARWSAGWWIRQRWRRGGESNNRARIENRARTAALRFTALTAVLPQVASPDIRGKTTAFHRVQKHAGSDSSPRLERMERMRALTGI